ncbi:MAG: FG-GAP repeat protein [Thermoanaerobaculia bacterium]
MRYPIPAPSPSSRLLPAAIWFGALLLAAGSVWALPGFLGVSTVRGRAYDNEPLFFAPPQEGDHFALSLATGDFNGDGAEDLATGIPDDDGVAGFEVTNAGAFVVRYGVPGVGLAPTSIFFSQFSAGSPDPQDVDDQFGYALAAGDFNGDQIDDLAVSVPGHREGVGIPISGAVAIHYGTLSGLEPDASEWLVPGFTTSMVPAAGHHLLNCGQALATGDFDHDGYADLVIGCPFSYISIVPNPVLYEVGSVIVLLGGPQGLLPFVGHIFDQDSPDILGGAEEHDHLGAAVATADFDGDSFDDLAIGVPGEDGKGIVQIVFGGAGGLDLPNNVLYFQHHTGGLDEAGDQFGQTLAAGDLDGDGFDDLTVGAPFEDETSGFPDAPDTGAISVMFGSAAGINLARSEYLQQSDIQGVGAVDQSGDRFGFALAAGDLDGDGRADLAVGHPGEANGGADRGAVTLLMGGPGGVLTRFGDLFAGADGYPGEVQDSQDYGASAATGDFDGDGFADLVIGSPYFNAYPLANVGAEVVLYGSLFSNGFASGAIETWSASTP